MGGAGAVTLYNTELTEEIALSNAVTAANNRVTVSINQQASALVNLSAQYQRLAASRMPGGAAPPLRFATGGKVPGTGSSDKVPALLTPGEFVVKKQVSQKNSGFLSALNNGSVKGFNTGGDVSLSAPNSGKLQVSSTSGASIELDIDPSISDAELIDIKESIERAIKQGVIEGSQEGLDRAKADMDRGLSNAVEGKQTGNKSREVRSDFSRGSGNTGQAMKRTDTWGIAAAHDTAGQQMTGAEYLAPGMDRGTTSNAKRMEGFLTGTDVPADHARRDEFIKNRQRDVRIQRTSASVDPQPTWVNDASKREGGAGGREASMSLRAMHNDPNKPDLLDGSRASFAEYADDENLNSQQRAHGLQKIEEAEQRLLLKLEEQANSLDDTVRWVESSEQKAKETDIAWNDVKSEVENYGSDDMMADFDKKRKMPGKDGRLETRDSLRINTLSDGMGANVDGRVLTDMNGTQIGRTGGGRELFKNGKLWTKPSADLRTNTAGKQKMMNAGFTPAEVKKLETEARIAGLKVSKMYTTAVKQGVEQARTGGLVSGKIKLDAIRAGQEVSAGVVQGMQQGEPAVYKEGQDTGKAAIDGAEDKLQIASPSRVFKRIGKMVTTGFVGGMKEGTPAVKQEGAKVGGAAVQGAEAGAKGAAKAGKKSRMGMGGMGGSQMAQMGVGMGVSAMSSVPHDDGQG